MKDIINLQIRPQHATDDIEQPFLDLHAPYSRLTKLNHIPVSLDLVRHSDPKRKEVESFIHQVFAKNYKADIKHFMPVMLSLRSHSGQLLAALGIRGAAQESLFLENYLDCSIEDRLYEISDTQVARNQIVEIGNLAAFSRGAARWLVIALTAYMYGRGFKWITFTALPALHNSFTRLGLEPIALASAEKICLPPEARDGWGNYYDKKPVVYCGDISRGYESINCLIEPDMREHWLYWQHLAHEHIEQASASTYLV
jgi:hypothetical protein